MNEKKYFQVCVFKKFKGGCHIIKAYSEEDALRIRKKFKISYPFGATGKLRIRCNELDLEQQWVKNMLNHRRVGFGGHIWYEDENGQLQTEE